MAKMPTKTAALNDAFRDYARQRALARGDTEAIAELEQLIAANPNAAGVEGLKAGVAELKLKPAAITDALMAQPTQQALAKSEQARLSAAVAGPSADVVATARAGLPPPRRAAARTGLWERPPSELRDSLGGAMSPSMVVSAETPLGYVPPPEPGSVEARIRAQTAEAVAKETAVTEAAQVEAGVAANMARRKPSPEQLRSQLRGTMLEQPPPRTSTGNAYRPRTHAEADRVFEGFAKDVGAAGVASANSAAAAAEEATLAAEAFGKRGLLGKTVRAILGKAPKGTAWGKFGPNAGAIAASIFVPMLVSWLQSNFGITGKSDVDMQVEQAQRLGAAQNKVRQATMPTAQDLAMQALMPLEMQGAAQAGQAEQAMPNPNMGWE